MNRETKRSMNRLMKRTSQGFHTFTMACQIFCIEQLNAILHDFRMYSKKSGNIIIEEEGKNHRIKFKTFNGVTWLLRYCTSSDKFKYYAVEVTINPKILTEENEYLAASDQSYLEEIELRYNSIIKLISEHLPLFSAYSLKRIDFCINFDIRELRYLCPAEVIIKLFRRGNIPHWYKEREEYSKTNHRWESDKTSFYLESNTVNVNCYWKYPQMEKKDSDSPFLENAKHIIRFEIQFKYGKLYNMKRIMKEKLSSMVLSGYKSIPLKTLLLSDEVSHKVVKDYYSKVIMGGDYHTLENAKSMVMSCGYRANREARLLAVLDIINKKRSIFKAREYLINEHLQGRSTLVLDFNRSLHELVELGINPVTLPLSFGHDFIQGLLSRYEETITPPVL